MRFWGVNGKIQKRTRFFNEHDESFFVTILGRGRKKVEQIKKNTFEREHLLEVGC